MKVINFNKTQKSTTLLCFLLFWLSFCISTPSKAQQQFNLVNNYSFEQTNCCPTTLSNWCNPTYWQSASKSSIKISNYNICSNHLFFTIPKNICGGTLSYQYPHSGNGCSGGYFYNGNNNREYEQTLLNEILLQQKKYLVEFFVSRSNSNDLACNNVGALLTINRVVVPDTTNNPLGFISANAQVYNYGNPIISDTLNWVKVSSVYIAQGGEQYITIGNFKDNSHTNYIDLNPNGTAKVVAYYIDDVSVIPLDSFCLKADAGRDTTISVNDSVFIGSYTNGIDTIKWYNAAGQVIDSTKPGFWVKPTTTGTSMYIVEQTVNGCYSRDTVYVNVVLPLKFLSYSCVPSLRGTKQSAQNIWQTANEINVSHFKIQRSINAKDFVTIGTVRANNKSYNEYSFEDKLKTEDQDLKTLYYRIQAVDKDGTKTYSEVKTLNLKPSTLNSVSIYPNPAKDVVTISSKEPISKLLITDYLGRNIATGTNISNDGNLKLYTLNLKHLSKGLYIVQILLANGKIVNEKLWVQ